MNPTTERSASTTSAGNSATGLAYGCAEMTRILRLNVPTGFFRPLLLQGAGLRVMNAFRSRWPPAGVAPPETHPLQVRDLRTIGTSTCEDYAFKIAVIRRRVDAVRRPRMTEEQRDERIRSLRQLATEDRLNAAQKKECLRQASNLEAVNRILRRRAEVVDTSASY